MHRVIMTGIDLFNKVDPEYSTNMTLNHLLGFCCSVILTQPQPLALGDRRSTVVPRLQFFLLQRRYELQLIVILMLQRRHCAAREIYYDSWRSDKKRRIVVVDSCYCKRMRSVDPRCQIRCAKESKRQATHSIIIGEQI